MRHLLIFVFLLAILKSNGQQPVTKEFRNLTDRIYHQLFINETWQTKNNSPEYILCMLKVDTLGKIVSVNVLADPQNIGPIYKVINSIPLSVFDGWISQKAMGHTIIFPIAYCPGKECPDYINDLVNTRGDKSDFSKIINETSTTILFTAFRLYGLVEKY
jgi:hypothetical protein